MGMDALLFGEIMNVLGDSFLGRGSWFNMDDNVNLALWGYTAHGVHCSAFDTFGQGVGLLEGEGTRCGDNNVGKILVARAAHADTADFGHILNALDLLLKPLVHLAWCVIEQSVNGFFGQAQADPDDDAGDAQGGNSIGLFEPERQAKGFCQAHHEQTGDDDRGTPDVGTEMQRVGLKGLATELTGDAQEDTRAGEIDAYRNQHDGEGPDTGIDGGLAGNQALNGFIDNPTGGEQQETGLEKGGEILDFAMAIIMGRVGRLIGDADSKKRHEGCDQVQT